MEDNTMMKKSFKNRSAVSPVIATILMVAITVVLAAVLYVMVMGFGGTTPQAPTAQLTNDVANNRVVVSCNPATDLDDMRFSFNGTTAGVLGTPQSSGGITVTFVDLGGDGKVTTGDYFQYSGTGAGGMISLLWVSGDTTQSVATVTI
jgi:flagellin-like protein